ncbi:hypothetical protein [Candidatus Protochlamydia phocaeensis]|uniref:hypothetical protein n=1 Tax=Candidatus Protochlamydia phocaeensis TaxID=1414722 RepID=UPI000838D8C2|nr:hypothetical protein [Candidatus Protochlamydia phocaeensis]
MQPVEGNKFNSLIIPESTGAGKFESLPMDVLKYALSYFAVQQSAQIALVNKRFYLLGTPQTLRSFLSHLRSRLSSYWPEYESEDANSVSGKLKAMQTQLKEKIDRVSLDFSKRVVQNVPHPAYQQIKEAYLSQLAEILSNMPLEVVQKLTDGFPCAFLRELLHLRLLWNECLKIPESGVPVQCFRTSQELDEPLKSLCQQTLKTERNLPIVKRLIDKKFAEIQAVGAEEYLEEEDIALVYRLFYLCLGLSQIDQALGIYRAALEFESEYDEKDLKHYMICTLINLCLRQGKIEEALGFALEFDKNADQFESTDDFIEQIGEIEQLSEKQLQQLLTWTEKHESYWDAIADIFFRPCHLNPILDILSRSSSPYQAYFFNYIIHYCFALNQAGRLESLHLLVNGLRTEDLLVNLQSALQTSKISEKHIKKLLECIQSDEPMKRLLSKQIGQELQIDQTSEQEMQRILTEARDHYFCCPREGKLPSFNPNSNPVLDDEWKLRQVFNGFLAAGLFDPILDMIKETPEREKRIYLLHLLALCCIDQNKIEKTHEEILDVFIKIVEEGHWPALIREALVYDKLDETDIQNLLKWAVYADLHQEQKRQLPRLLNDFTAAGAYLKLVDAVYHLPEGSERSYLLNCLS